FSVTYSDDIAINVSTLNTGDVTVSGPGGFTATPTFVSVDNPADGTPRIATYSFTPPGGTWNTADNGTYNIVMQANQVADTAGNFVAAGTIGTFAVVIGDVTAPDNPIVGVGATLGSPTSTASTVGTVPGANNHPATEGPDKAIDNDLTVFNKYLNFAETGIGFITTPATQTVVTGVHFFTGNDAPERDPLTISIEGTNSPNATTTLNSTWTTVYNGASGLATDPGRRSPGAVVNFANTSGFTSYRVLVASIRNGATANAMQFSEIALIGTTFTASPQTFTVTNLNDTGAGSLRQAILDANANSPAADTINFQAGLAGTINLSTALPNISDSVTISGPGANVITVRRGDGTPDFRIFTSFSAGLNVAING
ncbi:MAG: hypothetical protein ABL959_24665, partial [Pyrinomonadaceae bacterium]